MSLEQFNYSNKEIAQEIYSAMNSTKFLGISVGIFPQNFHMCVYVCAHTCIETHIYD